VTSGRSGDVPCRTGKVDEVGQLNMEAACLKVTETHDEADTVGSRVPGLR
jgi:hypothetical protein